MALITFLGRLEVYETRDLILRSELAHAFPMLRDTTMQIVGHSDIETTTATGE